MVERCPKCNYSLTGLPATHACPECGLRYDERSSVWRSKPHWSAYLGCLGSIGAFPTILRLINTLSFLLAAAIVVMYVVVFGGSLYLVWRDQRRGRYAAAMADGLHLRLGKFSPSCIPWNEIAGAKSAYKLFGVHHAKLSFRSQRRHVTVAGVFRGKADAERFADVVNAYASEYDDTRT